MKLSLYWQDWHRTVYPIVYPMSRTFQKILMKKRSFLEFGGLWSCRRVVIPKFSRVIIYFFGIYHLSKIVGGQFVQKTPVERTIFLELACWKRAEGGCIPQKQCLQHGNFGIGGCADNINGSYSGGQRSPKACSYAHFVRFAVVFSNKSLRSLGKYARDPSRPVSLSKNKNTPIGRVFIFWRRTYYSNPLGC